MFEKREELVQSQAELLLEDSSRKWGWMKGLAGVGVGVLILSASLLVLGGVHLYNVMLEVSRSWISHTTLFSSFPFPLPPCLLLYLFLNILILTLALKSTSASASSCQCSQLYRKPDSIYEYPRSSPSFERVRSEERVGSPSENGEEAGEREREKVRALQRSSSVRELHCTKVKKASNLSRESRLTHPHPPVEVIFEICSMEEECCLHEDEEEEKEKEGILNMSCEELNAKAETFIGNFYRELKMQREESWKHLCAIYRKSC